MAYGSIDDILDLGYIPEEDLDALHAERETRIPRLFEAESAIFDSYMRPRYGVPMPGSPALIELTFACVSIVVAHLYIVRGFPSIPEGSEVAKEILAARDRAFAFRKDIRDGVAQLDPLADATPGSPEAGASKGSSPQPSQFSGSYAQTSTGRRSGCC
jgi:phage gp36-like protein